MYPSETAGVDWRVNVGINLGTDAVAAVDLRREISGYFLVASWSLWSLRSLGFKSQDFPLCRFPHGYFPGESLPHGTPPPPSMPSQGRIRWTHGRRIGKFGAGPGSTYPRFMRTNRAQSGEHAGPRHLHQLTAPVASGVRQYKRPSSLRRRIGT